MKHGRLLAAAIWSTIAVQGAHAQRASENAVTQAEDAFGTTIGNEKIGIYNEDDVRGFSPIEAGNARIEGLYFDKVGDENDRLQNPRASGWGSRRRAMRFPSRPGLWTMR